MPRLGVLGTLVLDTIHRPQADGGAPPVRDWGGIAYTLAALDVLAPPGWDVFPIVKVGADLGAEADQFFARLTRVRSMDGVRTVDAPNNRVELFYHGGPRRCERLTGGVPGWTWPELEPLAASCDALLVNFIAGWEIDLAAAEALANTRPGCATYADIHSLLLAVGPDGVRTIRPLPAWPAWRRCFDWVQMNAEEMAALASPDTDLDATAREWVLDGPELLFVTLAEEGSRWFGRIDGRVVDGVEATEAIDDGIADPTGCGDVWGAACMASLLEDAGPGEAAARANRIAGAAATVRGTRDLAAALGHGTVAEAGTP